MEIEVKTIRAKVKTDKFIMDKIERNFLRFRFLLAKENIDQINALIEGCWANNLVLFAFVLKDNGIISCRKINDRPDAMLMGIMPTILQPGKRR